MDPHAKAFLKWPFTLAPPGDSPLFLPGAPKGSSRYFLNLRVANAIFFLIICPHTKFQIHKGPGVDSGVWWGPPNKRKAPHFSNSGYSTLCTLIDRASSLRARLVPATCLRNYCTRCTPSILENECAQSHSSYARNPSDPGHPSSM